MAKAIKKGQSFSFNQWTKARRWNNWHISGFEIMSSLTASDSNTSAAVILCGVLSQEASTDIF